MDGNATPKPYTQLSDSELAALHVTADYAIHQMEPLVERLPDDLKQALDTLHWTQYGICLELEARGISPINREAH
jgi:hypothetical protein